MFARIRDELDAISNLKKEDKILVTGLTNSTPMPQGVEDRRKWLNNMVGGIFNKIVPNSSRDILYIDLGKRNTKESPLAEVKMKNNEIALTIRRQFALKRKGGGNFGRLWIANAVTLATRVRIEILKGMAKQFTREDEISYVNAYVSRPTLTLKKKDSTLKPLVLTFSDALLRFGKEMREEHLQEAYKRAGTAFRGQMQQNFVVLKEDREFERGNRVVQSGLGSKSMGTPLKRLRQGEEEEGGSRGFKATRKKKKKNKKKKKKKKNGNCH